MFVGSCGLWKSVRSGSFFLQPADSQEHAPWRPITIKLMAVQGREEANLAPIRLYRWRPAGRPCKSRRHSAFRLLLSAFCFPPSAFCLPHSALRIPHSELRTPHSALQSPLSLHNRWSASFLFSVGCGPGESVPLGSLFPQHADSQEHVSLAACHLQLQVKCRREEANLVPICLCTLYRWLARIPHSAFRTPHSAFCFPPSAFRTPHRPGQSAIKSVCNDFT